jgi:hypothetical protein
MNMTGADELDRRIRQHRTATVTLSYNGTPLAGCLKQHELPTQTPPCSSTILMSRPPTIS